jgi:diguanylate cyclase (GGDEF)-like protein
LLLVIGEVGLAFQTKGVSADYSGFFTLAFLYIGLTQRRGTGPIFALVAGPSWVAAQQLWAVSTAIKLILVLVIWVLMSDVLATRTARDATRSRRLVDRANTDSLTGLGNRLALSDRLTLLGSDPFPMGASLLLIDLDGFKKVNDTFGHAVGDELLTVVARRLRSTLREEDLAVRLGGDEFAVLLEGGIEEARQVAARTLTSLAAPIALSRSRLSMTASIGIVEIDSVDSVDVVLNQADLAMYGAKSAGRNQVAIYEHDMHASMVRRLDLETDLRDGLARDEFEVYYQPIVNMGTGTIVGAEALVRWQHPRRGLLAPVDFLATCEELGLLELVGEQVLLKACDQARRWQSIDPARAFSLAVNVSAEQVFSPYLVGRVERALQESGLPARLLVLEITEHIIMADKVLARKRMEELKALGVRIAIDDFGTGYSSLAYLREFPVDILKIDRSFVTPLGSDVRASALFSSIVSIAEALSLDVIVEGIETAEQAEIVVQLGCLVAQGFYFARPQSGQAFVVGHDALFPVVGKPSSGLAT